MDGFWPTFIRREWSPQETQPALTDPAQCIPMPRPAKVVLSLQDVPEEPYEVQAELGQRVLAGQRIGTMGQPPRYLAVHAPCAGEVTAIEQRSNDSGGERQIMAVEITCDGSDAAVPLEPFRPSGQPDGIAFLRDMGIPFDYQALREARKLIVNFTEFEPTVSTRQALLLSHFEEFIVGLQFIMGLSKPLSVLLLTRQEHGRTIKYLKKITARIAGTQLKTVSQPYPDTLQPLMSYRRRLSDQSASATILDPGLIIAAGEACQQGQPFTQQLVTVAGSALPVHKNIWIYTGTPLIDILSFAGVSMPLEGRVALGGPLMGGPRHSLQAGIGKKARGLFAASAFVIDDERKSRFYQSGSCVRCGKCFDVCPAGITPVTIAELVKHHREQEAHEYGLLSCLECGLCEYVCPAQQPLVEIIKLGKLLTRGRESLLVYNMHKTLST